VNDHTPADWGDDQVASWRRLLDDEGLWVEPSPGGAETLLTAIRQESAPDDARGHERALWGRTRGARLRRIVTAAAAAVVFLAGIVGAFLVLGNSEDPAEERHQFVAAGTDLAPDASAVAAVVERQAGIVIELDISGLPPARSGTYYQGWVRGPDGLVPLGTFHLRSSDTVYLWSGVDLDAYPRFVVTLQEEGGGPEQSDQVVLVGDVGL
jgi:hypothetical protein